MKTVAVYCTSNREDEGFEQRVRDNILKVCGGMSIISFSQKPINFGENICVGDDIGVSGFNFFKQVQIGCEATDADFILSLEADCLYPESYFQFTPPDLTTCYRTTDLYVMPDKRAFYFHKSEGATHGQIVGRKFYLNILNELFKGAPQWSVEEKNFPRERHHKLDIFDKIEYFNSSPVIQIKSHKGMRYYTHSDRTPIYNLPYWGDGVEFRKKYYE